MSCNLSVKPNLTQTNSFLTNGKDLAVLNTKHSKLGKAIGKVISEASSSRGANSALTNLQPITMVNTKR